MSNSNIYMQMITERGPVLGEGLLEGFEGSIELKEFNWGMHVLKDPGEASALNKAKSLVGLGKPITVKLEPLEFVKRFDVGSMQMHLALDRHWKIISTSITVLHIKPVGALGVAMHQPGFVLLCTDGYFSEISLDLAQDGNMTELVETCKLNFKNINMTYLKKVDNVVAPTAPFFYPKITPF
jgi:type VI protein secretion system component Hcp